MIHKCIAWCYSFVLCTFARYDNLHLTWSARHLFAYFSIMYGFILFFCEPYCAVNSAKYGFFSVVFATWCDIMCMYLFDFVKWGNARRNGSNERWRNREWHVHLLVQGCLSLCDFLCGRRCQKFGEWDANQELLPVARHCTKHPARWLGKTLRMWTCMYYAMILKIPIFRPQRVRSSMCITSRLRCICCAAMAGSWPRTAVVQQTLGDDRIRYGQPEINACCQWTVLLVDLRGSRPSSPSQWLIQGPW